MNIIEDKNIISGFSDSQDGDLSFYLFENEESTEAWKNLSIVSKNSLREPVYVSQIHGSEIVEVTDNFIKWEAGKADALITKLQDVPIGVFSADCLPLTMWSGDYIAAIHAGWRGTLANISAKAAKLIAEKSNTETSKIKVAIGACIDVCCLEVGNEVYSEFTKTNPDYSDFFVKKNKWHLNLKELNVFQLKQAGIIRENISINEKCTYCNKNDFYSFRRQKKRNGTMFSFIVRKSQI